MNILFSGSPFFIGVLTLVLIALVVWFIYFSFFKRNSESDDSSSIQKLNHVKSIGLFALVVGVLHQLLAWYNLIYEIEQAEDITANIVLSALKTSLLPLIYGVSIYLFSLILWLVSRYISQKYKSKSGIILILLITFFSHVQEINACTILTSSSSSAVFAGNNEDMCSTNTIIHIIPPGDNKYGRILWGFAYDGNCQGGMNEFGLFFDGAGLPHVDIPKRPLPQYNGEFVMEGVLENCKTVEEAIAYLKNYELSFLAVCHILIADGTGDAAIMEWGNGKVNFIRKGDKSYLIATNFNQSEPALNAYNCARFEIASKILAEKSPSLQTFEQVLSHTRQEGNYCTVYSNICDLKAAKMYLYNFHDFSINKEFDLKEEFKKGEQKRMIRSFFPPSFAENIFRMRQDCISTQSEIPNRNVTFKISCNKTVPSDTITLRGSAAELGRWNKEGVQLKKVSDSLYTMDIIMKQNELFDFILAVNDRSYIPFKKSGKRIKEMDVEIKSDTTIYVDIFEWKKLE